jgi:hypothetical protein
MPCSGRPSKERRAAPPFPVWRGIPQSSPMVAPVCRYGEDQLVQARLVPDVPPQPRRGFTLW